MLVKPPSFVSVETNPSTALSLTSTVSPFERLILPCPIANSTLLTPESFELYIISVATIYEPSLSS